MRGKGIKHKDVLGNHDENGAITTDWGFPAVFAIKMPMAQTTTPTITNLGTVGQNRQKILSICGRHRQNTWLLLLVQPSLHLGSYCPIGWPHKNHDIERPLKMPARPGLLSETGGTPLRALYVWLYET